MGRLRHFTLVAAIAALVIVLTHDVAQILSKPFWLDELWVALSANYPISDLPHLTSSTPIGWNVLQRLFAPLGEHAQRLLPLIFSWLATIVAYFLGYAAWTSPRLTRMMTGIFVSTSVTFLPLMLTRNDLKQYTADVFFALLFLLLIVHMARAQSRLALYALTLCAALSLVFSVASVFPALSAFAALVLMALVQRDFPAMWRYIACGAVAGASMVALFFGFYRVALDTSLSRYWEAYYPCPHDLLRYLGMRVGEIVGVNSLAGQLAVGLGLVIILGTLGCLAWRAGQRALAVYPVIVCGVMCLAGVLRFYPLLDKRTSLFLIVTMAAMIALTLARLVTVSKVFGGSWQAALCIITMAGIIWSGIPSLRAPLPTHEDARSQIAFIRDNAHPGDVIVTDLFGALALAYYWPGLHAQWVPDKTYSIGFIVNPVF